MKCDVSLFLILLILVLMKRFLFSIACFGSVVLLFGQNLKLSNANGPLNNGDTVIRYIANDVAHEEHVYVTNISTFTIPVKVRKHTIQLLAGAFNTFCWGQCFSPTVEVSPSALPIDAGQTNTTSFYADYNAWGVDGLTIVRYIFFNDNAPLDTADVVIKFYTTPASVNEHATGKADISLPYPNPASSKCQFSYSIPSNVSNASLVIIDLAGNIVHKEQLMPGVGKTTVDVSTLSSGIYFYSLRINDNSVVTRKLIVQK